MTLNQRQPYGKRKYALVSLRAVEMVPPAPTPAPSVAAMMASSSALVVEMMFLPLHCFIHAAASVATVKGIGVPLNYREIEHFAERESGYGEENYTVALAEMKPDR